MKEGGAKEEIKEQQVFDTTKEGRRGRERKGGHRNKEGRGEEEGNHFEVR